MMIISLADRNSKAMAAVIGGSETGISAFVVYSSAELPDSFTYLTRYVKPPLFAARGVIPACCRRLQIVM
jgi:hypothetical protein